MAKRLQKRIALACVICLTGLLLCGYASIDDVLPAANKISYQKVPVSLNGEVTYSGYLVNDVTYLPFRSFCKALNLGAVAVWNSETQEAVGLLDGYNIYAKVGEPYVRVNGRYFYAPQGVIDYQGTVLVPLRLLCDAFGIAVDWDEESGLVSLTVEEPQVCTSGGEFYNEDDLYWLARIISAEAKDQNVVGKVCVGNVVCNRVANAIFPDTVKDVIFDKSFGVTQFDPVRTGTIYNEPDEGSVIAAKMCLEGCSLAGDSLYFVNPSVGSAAWFNRTRTYVMTMGDHSFYA